MVLDKVAILIKTFLRDEYLYETVRTILKEMPEAQLIVVDDGHIPVMKTYLYHGLINEGHVVELCPFDSGFGYKSNRGAALCTRPYLLIGSDDFDFHGARPGIEKLVAVLEAGAADIASGRVHNNRYEGRLTEVDGTVHETYIDLSHPCEEIPGIKYYPCDLTVNYSLICASILGPGKIHWDDDVKIGGGEHGAFFVDVKRAGHRVVYVEGVNINEQRSKPMDPHYGAFRGRARQPERPCFDRRGVKQYYCFGGNPDISYGPK
ncbi:Uncharacterised protein [uncultured archaeon]|nr:Uncharacterised protein [uncultured archaeon]